MFSKSAWAAGMFCLILAGCGGGGGGGGGGSAVDNQPANNNTAGCSSTTVYDSYGYSNPANGTANYAIELGDAVTMPLAAHVVSGCALRHQLTGTLPVGVSFDTTSGQVSGTPTQIGTFNITVRPAATGNVSAGATLRIDPQTTQTQLLVVDAKIVATLPASLILISAAVVDHGSGEVLYGLFHGLVEGHQLWKSTDGGAHWTQYTGNDLPVPQGNSVYPDQFVLARNGSRLDLVDAGGSNAIFNPDNTVTRTTLPPRLFRFDGNAWVTVASALPFRLADFQRPQEYVHSDGSVWIAWGGLPGVQIWRSSDQGTTWTDTQPGKFVLPGFNYKGGICLSGAADQIRTLWFENGIGPDFGFWDPVAASWPHDNFLNQQDWPAAPMKPGFCASFKGISWAFSNGSKPTGAATDSHVMSASIAKGQATYLYPRRLLTIPGFQLMTPDGISALYGFNQSNAGLEIWRLH